MAQSLGKEGTEERQKEKVWFDPEEYTLRKRLPRKLPKRKNDVYVNMKTNFKAQLNRCEKLINNGENELYIHGLGNACNRAINLALQLKSNHVEIIEVSVNTSTVELVDDWEPEYDHLESHTQIRNNSAVHIKVYRLNPINL
ncbi:ribonuclease P protein subunit p20 [Centruroides vittatus]|uniref:ribonuclease P protein subunit p20 n=1 Tax=Centruroides vittatus TaxID=120091 RepID=UPI00350F21F3